MRPFGAILAGGESRRYGAPKALAEVGGRRIIDRVVATLGAVSRDLVLIANDPDLVRDLGLPMRPDIHPGLGALGGIHTALRWADDEGRPGVLAVAVDMPFLSRPLLARLCALTFGDGCVLPAELAGPGPGAGIGLPDLAIPESRGRRGVEPLCAAYRVTCLPAIEAQIARGDHHMIGFHDRVRVRRVPLREVESLCDPDVAFMNVNTPEERDRAETLARAGGAGGGPSHAG